MDFLNVFFLLDIEEVDHWNPLWQSDHILEYHNLYLIDLPFIGEEE